MSAKEMEIGDAGLGLLSAALNRDLKFRRQWLDKNWDFISTQMKQGKGIQEVVKELHLDGTGVSKKIERSIRGKLPWEKRKEFLDKVYEGDWGETFVLMGGGKSSRPKRVDYLAAGKIISIGKRIETIVSEVTETVGRTDIKETSLQVGDCIRGMIERKLWLTTEKKKQNPFAGELISDYEIKQAVFRSLAGADSTPDNKPANRSFRRRLAEGVAFLGLS